MTITRTVLFTPTPTPSASVGTPAATPADTNWDAVSAVSDVIVAFGTLVTLIFVARTVRHQGKALGLQIRQLESERAKQETDRLRAEGDERQRKINNARRVKFSAHKMEHDPKEDPRILAIKAIGPQMLLAEEMYRETGATPWFGTAVEVHNGSDEVIRNLSFHGEEVSRARFIWRRGGTSLLPGYELDQLAPGNDAFFLFVNIKRTSFQEGKPELRFSDEDGYRWRTDFDSHTARIDDLRT